MRRFLLRLLIAWYMIPFMYIFFFPLCWLVFGKNEALDIANDMAHILWYGYETTEEDDYYNIN